MFPKEWVHFYALINLVLARAVFDDGRQLLPVPTEDNCLAPAYFILHAYIPQKSIDIAEHFSTQHAYFLNNIPNKKDQILVHTSIIIMSEFRIRSAIVDSTFIRGAVL